MCDLGYHLEHGSACSVDDICCANLCQVYKACKDWVGWDMEGRAQYLHALLNAVHIYALPPKFLKNQLLSCPILSKVPALCPCVKESHLGQWPK